MDDRAVSRVLSYSLTLTISTVLVSGLFIAGGTFVNDQQSNVIESELEVIGERLAADISAADRLVRMGSGETAVRIDTRVPSTIARANYVVRVRATDGNTSLQLDTRAIDRSVELPISNTTAVSPGNATGGNIVVVYDQGNDHLELNNG